MDNRRNSLSGIVLALLLGLLAAGGLVFTVITKPAEAAFPGQNGKIVFTSDRDHPFLLARGGETEIYVMNADGSTQTRLTNTTGAVNSSPALSPDGKRVAYSSNEPVPGGATADSDLFVMDATDANGDGKGDNRTRITNNSDLDEDPAWSPNGEKIVFTSERGASAGENYLGYDLYVINADGTGEVRLTDVESTTDFAATFSPDGSKIAFVRRHGGDYDAIYVINADGTGETRLTGNTFHAREPSWSPDGNRIAFEERSGGQSRLYVMNADGSGQTSILGPESVIQSPRWSPDGEKIAFVGEPEDPARADNDIFSVNADGSGRTNLTPDTRNSYERYPDWGVFVNTPDTTAPTVSLTAPASGATVSGTSVALSASASDAVGVSRVDFYVGTQKVGSDTTAPYSVNWDSTTVADGSKTITARAYDAAGNERTSASRTVTVKNTVTPPRDYIEPHVLSFDPSPGQTGVPRDASVVIEFSEGMDPASVDASTVKLQRYDKKRKKWRPVSGAVVGCDAACDTATLDPYGSSATMLLASTRYRATVSGAQDVAGNFMLLGERSIFTTGTR